ncbi:MAG: hypothetical protein U1C18_00125 [Patescibacteria group bacterium]|nr:hypothetical protein [bacterium]MDZ4221262.1 hypothetical protein [Patescibacteria group bacterium]
MHQEILSYLQNAASHKTLAHGHALIGPAGSGRRKLLGSFLKDFFGVADAFNHPDIRVIEPEEDAINIDTIRKARSWLSMTPIAADKKALIVRGAESIHPQAQNAFLKILEEPGQNTYIFLLTSHRRRILPTIYSRIVPLYFSAAPGSAQKTPSEHLIHSLLAGDTPPERMRLWLKEGIGRDDMRTWLIQALPKLRSELAAKRNPSLARELRNLIADLAYPSGKNWQLSAERLIISL